MVAHTRADAARRPADPSVAGARILVVEARYYDGLADELLAGARAAIEAARDRVLALRSTGEIGDDAYAVLEEAFDWAELNATPRAER